MYLLPATGCDIQQGSQRAILNLHLEVLIAEPEVRECLVVGLGLHLQWQEDVVQVREAKITPATEQQEKEG